MCNNIYLFKSVGLYAGSYLHYEMYVAVSVWGDWSLCNNYTDVNIDIFCLC